MVQAVLEVSAGHPRISRNNRKHFWELYQNMLYCLLPYRYGISIEKNLKNNDIILFQIKYKR